MRNMRNLFRNLVHRFAGFWRLEIGQSRYGGWHYHIVFHAPRGMRCELIKALPNWTNEPLDPVSSSQKFNRSQWEVVGVNKGWHLKRVYNVSGVLDYLAKVRIGSDGEPLNREERLVLATQRVREFDKFGVR